jgi:hypothetical protein
MEGAQSGIAFACPEAARAYKILKPLGNSNVVMEIERKNLPRYSVSMKKQ